MTSPHEILHPKHWKPAKGYANGVAATGRMVFTGGVVGWNDQQEWETDDFAAQVAQCLASIKAILAEAGARPHHLTRLTWYVTDKQEYLGSLRDIGAAYREHFGRHFPAMALVQVVALVEDRAKVEIEATAVIPEGE
jgi:enamine deaminase RidA (YjgF/YER057c/UK114 family)